MPTKHAEVWSAGKPFFDENYDGDRKAYGVIIRTSAPEEIIIATVWGLTKAQAQRRAALIVNAFNKAAKLVQALQHIAGMSKGEGRYEGHPEAAVEDCANINELAKEALKAAGQEI